MFRHSFYGAVWVFLHVKLWPVQMITPLPLTIILPQLLLIDPGGGLQLERLVFILLQLLLWNARRGHPLVVLLDGAYVTMR